MKKIKVNLSSRSYEIIIGRDIFKHIELFLKPLKIPREIFIITNQTIKKHFEGTLKKHLKLSRCAFKFHTTIDSEKAKSTDNALKLIEAVAEYAQQKKITIMALGGGVIGDLSSFIASIYKRGVPIIHVPTTLLAQVDSSIGGKTAIDLRIAKNLIGTFYQPKLVLCDINFLKTLDRNQIRCGLAEVVKYAAIKDNKFFSYLEDNYQAILSQNPQALEHVVSTCAQIKVKIVEIDEYEEKGIRTILNFGHTIGHAIEAAGGYTKYNHGEAISIGMLCAAKISLKLGMLSTEDYSRINSLITKIGLPQEITGLEEKQIIKAYKLDKKFIGKTNRMVLIKGIGKPIVCKNIPEKIILNAIKELFIVS